MITSVVAAFLSSGGRKAGTPFGIASTPVVAVHPFANARQDQEGGEVATGVTPVATGRRRLSGDLERAHHEHRGEG